METKYPYSILLVEDEALTRKNYATYLKTLFNEVFEAEDGEKAYMIYKNKCPDIMIIDINIPKLNGLELLRKIRENDHNIKAIMLTAHTDKAFLLDAVSLKLTKYLVKPASRKDLKEALELAIKEVLKYSVSLVKKIELAEYFSWDTELKDLKQHNKSIELTNKERLFLDLLLSYKNKVFTHNEIFDYVWDFDEEISINGLRNIVKRLRKKLPQDTIISIFNEGYKISV